ncbi:MAG: hypothetical protein GW818_09480, partial [Flavobacteriales bacterium]|nr:hypothetical protein [Flavobacteriales bacterium]
MKIKIALQIISVFMLINCTVAQPTVSSKNKKAIKLFEEGRNYYDARNNKLAELSFLEALQKDPNFV